MITQLITDSTGPSSLAVAVVGLGYVGLPLAVECAKLGMSTVGIDIDASRVQSLSLGHSHVEDIDGYDLQAALEGKLSVSNDFGRISNADIVVVCVPTPLGTTGNPDLKYVISATNKLTPHLQRGAVVILESTSYPGTTEEVVMPIIQRSNRELDEDFYLAFSPERIDPGNKLFNIGNTPRVVGGASKKSAERARRFYESIVSDVVVLSGTREAEMAKLIENTYRHVNIALVNELAIVCHELGINIWEAIQGASTKPFGFQRFLPGVGVGGHCIPIDPMYLDNLVKNKLGRGLKFISLAQTINHAMPRYVASRVLEMFEGAQPSGVKKVLLMGVAYKADVSDTRETPARELAKSLIDEGCEVHFHDPHLESFFLEDGTEIPYKSEWKDRISEYSAVVILQPHSEYLQSVHSHLGPNVFDCTGRLSDFVNFVL